MMSWLLIHAAGTSAENNISLQRRKFQKNLAAENDGQIHVPHRTVSFRGRNFRRLLHSADTICKWNITFAGKYTYRLQCMARGNGFM
jgi:hypothetical protein